MSTRIPTTPKSGCWTCCQMATIASWWGISSNRFTASVRQIHRFSMINLRPTRKKGQKGVWYCSRKISEVMWRCWTRPMMSFAIWWTKRWARLTTIKPIIWLQEVTSSGWPCHNIGQNFCSMMAPKTRKKRPKTRKLPLESRRFPREKFSWSSKKFYVSIG